MSRYEKFKNKFLKQGYSVEQAQLLARDYCYVPKKKNKRKRSKKMDRFNSSTSFLNFK